MTKYDKAVSVCFSGHRSVPFAKRRELKQCLKSEIAKAYADGYRYFYCGMAMGFDLLAAEAALSLQCELKDLQVIALCRSVVSLTGGARKSKPSMMPSCASWMTWSY